MEKKQEGLNNTTDGSTDERRQGQANSGSEIREGQEDSSILHDKKDPVKEIHAVTKKDISSTSQEEFIDDDKNSIKEDDA